MDGSLVFDSGLFDKTDLSPRKENDLASRFCDYLIIIAQEEKISSKTQRIQAFITRAFNRVIVNDMTQAQGFISDLESSLVGLYSSNDLSDGPLNSDEQRYIALCYSKTHELSVYLKGYFDTKRRHEINVNSMGMQNFQIGLDNILV